MQHRLLEHHENKHEEGSFAGADGAKNNRHRDIGNMGHISDQHANAGGRLHQLVHGGFPTRFRAKLIERAALDLDPQTLLLTMILVVLLAAGGCLLILLQDRKQTAMLWMAVAAVLVCVAVIGRVALPFLVGVAFVNSALLISFGLIWTAFRSLRDRPPQPVVIILPAAIWLGLCFVPEFRANMDLRIGLGLLLLLIPIGLATHELWLKRQGSRIIRWPVLAVLGIQVVLMLQRAVRSLVWPDVAYAPFEAAPGFDVMMIDVMTIMLVLSFSMIAFVKDQSVSATEAAITAAAVVSLPNHRW